MRDDLLQSPIGLQVICFHLSSVCNLVQTNKIRNIYVASSRGIHIKSGNCQFYLEIREHFQFKVTVFWVHINATLLAALSLPADKTKVQKSTKTSIKYSFLHRGIFSMRWRISIHRRTTPLHFVSNGLPFISTHLNLLPLRIRQSPPLTLLINLIDTGRLYMPWLL